MKITKFEHACFVVEQDGQSLIVDPGGYTTDLIVPDTVVAVIVTHKHPDHLSVDHLREVVAKNPDVVIVGHSEVLSEISGFNTQTVVANEGIKVGPFALEFFGGDHAVIDPTIPVIANLGVMINDTVYYPGDSFTLPEQPVKVLALPISAPWMKISEAVAFVGEVKPEFVFPTHDAILSDTGKRLVDQLIPTLTKNSMGQYQRLVEPIDL